jgi:transglutaminase-like putative cysteine protease
VNRRDFLRTGVVISSVAAWPRAVLSQRSAESAPEPGWRTFEVTSRIEIPQPEAVTQAWLPLPSVDAPDWVRNEGEVWSGNADTVTVVRENKYGAKLLHARWNATEAAPALEVISRFSTRDRLTDFSSPSNPAGLEPRLRTLYTAGTDLIPTDGIVRETATGIVKGAGSDLDKARAIYEWIVENTSRNPKTRGCGLGNIRFMLESGDLSGKCADLNALHVGLCRSIGIPARDVYGVRVAQSRYGYKSLGRSGDISKAQHCRAEVWLTGYGWVPVDPADVRKVVLEEKPGLKLDDPLVMEVRSKLFGAWEMNWMPYNVAHDVELPDSTGPTLGFLMYPQAEVGGKRLDSLDPENFRYALTAREIGI